jgi:hypothetical protein
MNFWSNLTSNEFLELLTKGSLESTQFKSILKYDEYDIFHWRNFPIIEH